jgi:hypothetical protein
MVKISNIEIVEDESIEALNRILKDKNIRIEREDDSEDIYSDYRIFENDDMIFHTIYPKELLVKVAQLIPESEVRLGRYEVFVGPDNKDLSQETLVLEI